MDRSDGVDLQFAESSDGSRIAFYESAPSRDGVPLLAIAGGPGADHRYLRVGGALDLVASGRRVVHWDQRGTGHSSDDAPGVAVADFLYDIDAVLGAAGTDRADLMGHSFGGYLATAYAASRPRKVRRMVLVGSMSPRAAETPSLLGQVFPDKLAEWLSARAKLPPRFPASSKAPFHAMEFTTPEARAAYEAAVAGHVYNVRVNDALRRDMEALDLSAGIGALDMPVAVLHGRWDAVIAPAASWAIHRAIPGSRLRIFERSGHSPFVEEPQEFAAEFHRFLGPPAG